MKREKRLGLSIVYACRGITFWNQ